MSRKQQKLSQTSLDMLKPGQDNAVAGRHNISNATNSNGITPRLYKEDLPDKIKKVLDEKCERVRSYLTPDKSTKDIDILAQKVLETDALIQAGVGLTTEEFTFVLPEVAVPIHTCMVCRNKDQEFFVLDAKQGDTICLGKGGRGCGAVVEDHKVHEGNMYRTFEGEVDRSHHGAAPDRLYSAAYNMRTQISKGAADSARLANLSGYVEMNLSQVGKDDKRTRVGYKDQMKKQAFDVIDHMSANCDFHGTVTERAKELFAGWRNTKEHVHQKNAVICACISAAYRTIATDEYRARELRRRELAVKRIVQSCSRCGCSDVRYFSMSLVRPGQPSQVVCRKPSLNSIPCGGMVRPIEVLEYPGEDTLTSSEDSLHPFACPHCGSRFNAIRSRDVHEKDCMKKIGMGSQVAFKGAEGTTYMVLDFVSEDEVKLINLTTGHEQIDPVPLDKLLLVVPKPVEPIRKKMNDPNGRMSLDPNQPMSEWGVNEARIWLYGIVKSRKTAGDEKLSGTHVEALCTALTQASNPDAATEVDTDSMGSVKRKRTRTAGQYLQMWNMQKLTDFVGGNAAVAKVFHEEISKYRAEKLMKKRNEIESKISRDRRAQQGRKSWLTVVASGLQNSS